MVAGMPRRYIGMNDKRTAMGRLMIGSKALRKCNKKSTITRLTVMASVSAAFSVPIARWMSDDRS